VMIRPPFHLVVVFKLFEYQQFGLVFIEAVFIFSVLKRKIYFEHRQFDLVFIEAVPVFSFF